MKSDSKSKATELSYESEDDSNNVDDPSQSENELHIDTSAGEETEEDEKEKRKMEQEEDDEIGEQLKSNTIRQLENVNANYFFEELTSDDEILTFQCPQNFNVSSLLNQTLDMNRVIKIKDDDGNSYKCQVLANNKKTLTCAFPSKKRNAALVKLPVAGHIIVKKSLKLPKKNILLEDSKKSDKIPIRDSVTRHPLLGKDWNEHMKNVRKQIKRHKKLVKKSMEHKKSLVEAEKERKEKKKKLKFQLSALKKKTFGM